MIRRTLLVLIVCASTIAAVPPGGGVMQPQQPPPAPAPPPMAPMPASTSAPTATPPPDPAMLARAKNELTQLQSGKIDRGMLTSDMSTLLTDDKLASVKSGIGNLGAPVSFEQQRTGTQDDVRYAIYLVTFANGAKVDFLMGVDAQGKIAALRLTPAQ
ncbi:MAG TPA: hypothetical protein VKR56_06590 [Candidatus Cybelea sp.]|nr:hypothetical protein [Candidatus Cybelea sp.]